VERTKSECITFFIVLTFLYNIIHIRN